MKNEMDDEFVTPVYKSHENDDNKVLPGAPEELPPTFDFADDVYVNTYISMPCGGNMLQGKVTKHITEYD